MVLQKILISGYTGFIGTHLKKRLADKTIYGLDVKSAEGVTKHFGWDSLNECIDPDCIVHLAGKAHDIENVANEHEYYDVNLGLTQIIFDHFLYTGARKFIYFSSVKAVADSVFTECLTEEASANPMNPYGKSKLEAEKYINNEFLSWKEKEISEGRCGDWKKVYILRPCMIHGPGNKGNLDQLIRLQKKGIPWLLGAYENSRSYCAIENLLYVVQQLIDREIRSDTYNVADDESISTNQLIKIIADYSGKKIRIWKIPQTIIRITAKMGDISGLPLNNHRLKKLTESYVVSNKKIKHALGIERMPYSAISGLKLTIESYIKQNLG